jgi:hypothetical protein
MKKIFLFLIILSVMTGSAEGQIFKRNASKKAERGLFGKTSRGKSKEVKVKQPRVALKAQKKQEANKKEMDKDYDKLIKKSQQRTIDIQTADVQERMKNNQKETIARDKAKKKNTTTATRRAGKKYK